MAGEAANEYLHLQGLISLRKVQCLFLKTMASEEGCFVVLLMVNASES